MSPAMPPLAMIEDMGSSSDLNRQDEPSKPQQEAHGSAKSKSVRFNLADTNYICVATRNELGPKEIENAWYVFQPCRSQRMRQVAWQASSSSTMRTFFLTNIEDSTFSEFEIEHQLRYAVVSH